MQLNQTLKYLQQLASYLGNGNNAESQQVEWLKETNRIPTQCYQARLEETEVF